MRSWRLAWPKRCTPGWCRSALACGIARWLDAPVTQEGGGRIGAAGKRGLGGNPAVPDSAGEDGLTAALLDISRWRDVLTYFL